MWPGNTNDSATIGPMATRLRECFGVVDICVVADRGMIGAQNVRNLISLGFSYILGVKMRL
ncbi:MAG: transposase [Actinomycetota bacterium]|nr:transposase [Actinomycetota bacterium]